MSSNTDGASWNETVWIAGYELQFSFCRSVLCVGGVGALTNNQFTLPCAAVLTALRRRRITFCCKNGGPNVMRTKTCVREEQMD